MKKISLKRLLKLKNIIIYDIRDIDEYLKYNIDNSINISFSILYKEYTKYFNKDNVYYILCEKGYRSKQLAKKLHKLGYKVIYVKGGIHKLYKFNL